MQGLRRWSRTVAPQPSRLPPPLTLGGARSGPPAPPAVGRFGSTSRRPFPLLGTREDRAFPRSAVLFVIHNYVGGGLPTPWCLGPLGSLRPSSGLRPL